MAKDFNYIYNRFRLSSLDKEVAELTLKDIPKYDKERADELASLTLFQRFYKSDEIRYHSFIRAANSNKKFGDNLDALRCLARANRLKKKFN